MPGLYNWAEARVWPSSVAQLPSLKLDIHDMCSCRASKVCNLPLLVKVHSTPRKLKGSAELKNKKRRLARDRSITAIFTVNLCSNMSNTRIKAGLTRLGTTSLSESRPWLLPTRSKMQMQPLCSLALPADGDWAICVLPKPTARPDVRHPAGARRVLRRDGDGRFRWCVVTVLTGADDVPSHHNQLEKVVDGRQHVFKDQTFSMAESTAFANKNSYEQIIRLWGIEVSKLQKSMQVTKISLLEQPSHDFLVFKASPTVWFLTPIMLFPDYSPMPGLLT
ncbi:hypothetical protein C8Q80DRAFT_1274866 [Daedaleopsis nitida]|nr:hypothetical protein C8Q80DRAFT_1274866 [Daedaleopsis nitida]